LAYILVIDDEKVIAMVIKEILESKGYKVVTASDGGTGIEYLFKHPKPDLVLTDLRMPGIDGCTVINTMNSDPDLRKIPKVIISGSIPELSDLPPENSYDALLVKPFDLDELIRTIQALTSADTGVSLSTASV